MELPEGIGYIYAFCALLSHFSAVGSCSDSSADVSLSGTADFPSARCPSWVLQDGSAALTDSALPWGVNVL